MSLYLPHYYYCCFYNRIIYIGTKNKKFKKLLVTAIFLFKNFKQSLIKKIFYKLQINNQPKRNFFFLLRHLFNLFFSRILKTLLTLSF